MFQPRPIRHAEIMCMTVEKRPEDDARARGGDASHQRQQKTPRGGKAAVIARRDFMQARFQTAAGQAGIDTGQEGDRGA